MKDKRILTKRPINVQLDGRQVVTPAVIVELSKCQVERGVKLIKVPTDQKTPSAAFSESTLTSDTWAQIKRRNKIPCGTRRTMPDSYFSEFMWRRWLQPGVDVFESILHEIAAYWPPE
ncbi:hypothetical protein M513_10903 [Trichuris suis]|uniref:Uncharacterized protein n=1 Tax=Trichuris suis TaxID=68888 RepID=A0A085LT93_9BILA|nr:hypothetical protein M513_10903 [Trichuris suis]